MMKFYYPDLSAELEDYMKDSKASERISKAEALQRGGVSVSRVFTMETQEVENSGDKYAMFGGFALMIEDAFSSMFYHHKIVAFTGYKISAVPTVFGVTYRAETIVVQAKDGDWN